LIVAIDRGFESPARKIFGWPWSCLLARRAPNILINENPVLVVWDEQGRPWFECRCGRRVKHTYLDELACRTCCRLDYASRHLHRQVPGVHRIMRWRRMIGRGIRRGRKRQAQRPAATRRRDGAGQEAQGHPAGGEA
jgi:hypothetical protein